MLDTYSLSLKKKPCFSIHRLALSFSNPFLSSKFAAQVKPDDFVPPAVLERIIRADIVPHLEAIRMIARELQHSQYSLDFNQEVSNSYPDFNKNAVFNPNQVLN